MNLCTALKWGSVFLGLHLILLVRADGQIANAVSNAAPTTSTAAQTSAEELDRPGEVENPFTLSPGTVQVIGYVLAANAEARENEDLGAGGSATLLQTGVRVGLLPSLEGQIFSDTYLRAADDGADQDEPGHSASGLGSITLRIKAQMFEDINGEDGWALVPFVRFPVSKGLAGQSGAEPGLIIPFDMDLDHGLEIQGSTGITYGFGDDGGRDFDWESQASLEWHPSSIWSIYIEPEVDAGEGRPRWALEQGITLSLGKRTQLDLGFNTGLASSGHSRFGYLGMAVTF
jgi:Putative MetA-pathway of phenol degradation